MMKIIFLPDFSKGNPYQRLLARGLIENGHTVHHSAYTKAWPILFSSSKGYDIVHIHWLENYLEWALRDKGFKGFLRKGFLLVDLLLVKLRGQKIIWTIHNEYSHELTDRKRERGVRRVLYAFANRVLVHSPSAVNLIKDSYGLRNTNKITVIPHGHYMDIYSNTVSRAEAREKLGLAVDDKVFLYFGIIRPYKGVERLIELFKNDPRLKEARLILAGKGLNEETDKNIRDAIADAPNIIPEMRFIDDDEIQVFMNAADCGVFPFENVLTSGSVICAMSFGLPIIVPRKGCLVDFVDEGKSGFLYNDKSELSEVLAKALHSDLREMARYNRDKIKEYDWKDISRSLEEVYVNA